jgi:hypothetical protein
MTRPLPSSSTQYSGNAIKRAPARAASRTALSAAFRLRATSSFAVNWTHATLSFSIVLYPVIRAGGANVDDLVGPV